MGEESGEQEDAEDGDGTVPGRAQGLRRRRRRGAECRGAGSHALPGPRHRRRRPRPGGGPPRSEPLWRDGARTARRGDLLPLPDPAEPRPRRGVRATGHRGPRVGPRRQGPHALGGPPDSRRVPGPDREAPPGHRARDTAPVGRGPRGRGVGQVGAQAVARGFDVMHATRGELDALHRALHPLSRKLAVRLTRKRRHGRQGRLDFRATMRRSLSFGGVPVDPRFRHPRPAKPEISSSPTCRGR